jgi:hypothetical protein
MVRRRNSRVKHGHDGSFRITRAAYVIVFIAVVVAASLFLYNGGYWASGQGSFVSQSTVSAAPLSNYSNTAKSGYRLNITFTVSNDEAAGNYGYWAILNYSKNVQAYSAANGTYNATIVSTGTWSTVKGARSPATGIIEPTNGTGRFFMVYHTTIVYAAPNASKKSEGVIGSYDFGGSASDLLRSEYNQTGPRTPFNWVTSYFGNSAVLYVSGIYARFTYDNNTYLFNYATRPNQLGRFNLTVTTSTGGPADIVV